MTRINPKGMVLKALYGRWRRSSPFEEGYTIVLPSPMDMPFLLRYALEGLARIDTEHCKQILVVPDGWGEDDGAALAEIVAASDDRRVGMVKVRPLDTFVLRRLGRTNGAATHWMAAVNGTTEARCAHVFLHDSDAFFLEASGLERQYRECRDRGMFTLGVTARWDPHFQKAGYEIPGTWELMFSNRWARSRSPFALKGGRRATPGGSEEFDSMLYPQFLDAPTGKVGVMALPPRLVHFSGTIVTYRAFRAREGVPAVDELFRVLLLAILEDLLPDPRGRRSVPTVETLARGLTNPDEPVTYAAPGAARAYPEFRAMIDDLRASPVFDGERGDRIAALLRPFDEHFEGVAAVPDETGGPRLREHGLA